MSIKYKEIHSDITLSFSSDVIQHFKANRQRKNSYEVGGQLFSNFSNGEVSINKVTGPRSEDSRNPIFYIPDKKSEQVEIDSLFVQEYHYIGDWHTHTEQVPHPSVQDNKNMKNIFCKSRHRLSHFLLVIVGQMEAPEGLFVGLHDGKSIKPCCFVPEE